MEQVKRPRNNIVHDYDDSKRKKISITTVETNDLTQQSITTFEDLSNELIYEIFEYLDFYHSFKSFSNLNQRFQTLFVYSNLPIKINISSISKSRFKHYLTHIIIPHAYRIKSLQISNPFAADMISLIYPTMTNLTRLETLIINNIQSSYIEDALNHFSCLPVLSSLIIKSNDYIEHPIDIYQKIFRLPALKYCQMSISLIKNEKTLPIFGKQSSRIEHLVILRWISLDQLDRLLSYIPQLRRLSLGFLDEPKTTRRHVSSITLNNLTDVSILCFRADFNDFETLVKDFFHQVEVLHISTCSHNNSSYQEYLDAIRWEQLISTLMPNLRIFDFQHRSYRWSRNNDRVAYKAQIDRFKSLFWIERKWFFAHRFFQLRPKNGVIFYSTDPFRRKFYTLYEELYKDNCVHHFETNLNAIEHVSIHGTKAIRNFASSFPNVNELTFSKTFDMSRKSVVTNLSRIIPLNQLTKLTLDGEQLTLRQVIELLYVTPNVNTIKLRSIPLYQTNSHSIQLNEIFRIVSNRNTITDVSIFDGSTLEKIQLLVALFPRMKHLKITKLSKEDLESITRFLLSKPNNDICHLSLHCNSKQQTDLVKDLRRLIELENLLHDYTINLVYETVHLWW